MPSLWRIGHDVAPLLPGLREVSLDEGVAVTDPRWQTVRERIMRGWRPGMGTEPALAALDSLEGEWNKMRAFDEPTAIAEIEHLKAEVERLREALRVTAVELAKHGEGSTYVNWESADEAVAIARAALGGGGK